VTLRQVEVVDRLEVEVRAVADLAQADVVLLGLAVGGVRLREIGKGGQQLVAALIQLRELRLELLELGLPPA
jgi:hypothetical protein